MSRASTTSCCVFAPSPLLTVTVEEDPRGEAEVHLHPGGQGFWIARMVAALGLDTTLCTPLGGEVGQVLQTLVGAEGVRVRATTTSGNGAYVHDRRGGEREPVADMAPAVLSRHQVDELYSSTLAAGLAADVTVLGGPATPDVVPADVYRRLASDLRAVERTVVADLSGETLTAAARGGLDVLKVSHDDLIEDGRADSAEPRALVEAMRRLVDEGVESVVVSRAEDPTLAWIDGKLFEAATPRMQRVDHRGAGDSMTAGLAVALARGEDLLSALRLGAAAGTANITRRGLATGQRGVIEELAEHIDVHPIDVKRG